MRRAACSADTNAKLLLTLHSFLVAYQKSLRPSGNKPRLFWGKAKAIMEFGLSVRFYCDSRLCALKW